MAEIMYFHYPKHSNKNNESSKLIFNNYILNKLNFDNLSPIKKRNSNKIFLKSNRVHHNEMKDLKVHNYQDKNNYKNSTQKDKEKNFINNNKTRPKSYKDLSLVNMTKQDSYILFKQYLLGKDVILPCNSVNNLEDLNMQIKGNNNYNRKTIFTPNKKIKSNPMKISYSSMKWNVSPDNSYIFEENIINNKRANKNKRKNIIQKQKYSHSYNNNQRITSVNSKKINKFNENLYNTLDINIFPKKNINRNSYFKTHQNFHESTDSLKKSQKYFISKDSKYPFFINNSQNKKKINTFKITTKNINNNINDFIDIKENYKSERNEKEKEKDNTTYLLAKKLIENPNSFMYLIYNKLKKLRLEEKNKTKKLDLHKRFEEYKKDLKSIEQSARFEVFNLKKQRIIGNEVNMKGKIISTNTYFNLATIRGDF